MSETNEAMRLRALAHPIRWKLIDVLGSELSATATRCAEVTGESVASCSYHLGILAKYGYIELVPDQPGRETPWRARWPPRRPSRCSSIMSSAGSRTGCAGVTWSRPSGGLRG